MAAKKQQKEKNLLVQGSILAVAGVITKIIGAVYRVPLEIGRASCRERV